jgi:hypothetical protein
MCDHIIFDNTNGCININDKELKDAPIKTNDSNNKDSGNGLITSIWGPPTWESFHSITFGYPISPTTEQKLDYMEYFRLLGKVLPCVYCRVSYDNFITDGTKNTLLDINTMKTRETLTRWGLALHDAVNNKLGVDYGVTYEELCYKYESYRARCTKTAKGCIMPLDMKACSYQKSDIHRAPIIDIKYSIALRKHAETLGLKRYDKFLKYFSNIKRNSKEWGTRDCAARKIMKYMRKRGISPLDPNGLPNKYEMLLFSMLSSTLEQDKINIICKNYIDCT